jgi:hypothetical protein
MEKIRIRDKHPGSARLSRTCEKVAAARILLQDVVGRAEDPEEEEGHRHRGGHQRTHRLQEGTVLSRPLSTQKSRGHIFIWQCATGTKILCVVGLLRELNLPPERSDSFPSPGHTEK